MSGDTCKCDSLIENSNGAHVLVQEALCCDFTISMSKILAKNGLDFASKIFSDITGYHTTIQDCVDISHTAKVGTMLLTHLVPSPDNNILESMFFTNISIPLGLTSDVVIGEDGMIVRVTDRGEVIFVKPSMVEKTSWVTILCILALIVSVGILISD